MQAYDNRYPYFIRKIKLKTFTLDGIDPENDCNFLNTCGIDFDVVPRSEFGSWIDYSTDRVILDKTDRIVFRVTRPEEELVLILRFGDKISGIV